MQTQFIATESLNTPPTHLHVASLIVHVRPEKMLNLKDWLATAGQIEIHAESAQGKLVLVTESDCEQAILRTLDELRTRWCTQRRSGLSRTNCIEDLDAEEQDV